jgi:hypothetical protein
MSTLIEVESVSAKTHDTSYGGYKWVVTVKINMPVTVWQKYKKAKNLGQLYGLEISNFVYSLNNNIPTSNPTVTDTVRAKNGIKAIELRYYLNDPIKAERLGLQVKQAGGEVYASYNDYVLIDSGNVFNLK